MRYSALPLVLALVLVFTLISFPLGFLWETKEGYSMSSSNSESEEISSNFEGFGVSLSTDKNTYSVGEAIIITLKAFNYDTQQVSFLFRSSQRFDFFILKGEEKFWQWSEDKFFAQVLGEVILEPKKIIIYQEKFSKKIEAGYYNLIGKITADDKPLTASFTIRVIEN